MWTESEAWKNLRRNGRHAVVRFDVFCGHCQKPLGTDLADPTSAGFFTHRPMDVFCSQRCISDYQNAHNARVYSYGWFPTLPHSTEQALKP